MQRKKASANIQIDNERIRVTEYSFNRNEETGISYTPMGLCGYSAN